MAHNTPTKETLPEAVEKFFGSKTEGVHQVTNPDGSPGAWIDKNSTVAPTAITSPETFVSDSKILGGELTAAKIMNSTIYGGTITNSKLIQCDMLNGLLDNVELRHLSIPKTPLIYSDAKRKIIISGMHVVFDYKKINLYEALSLKNSLLRALVKEYISSF